MKAASDIFNDAPAYGAYAVTNHALKRMKERNIPVSQLYNNKGVGIKFIAKGNIIITAYKDDRQFQPKVVKLKGIGSFASDQCKKNPPNRNVSRRKQTRRRPMNFVAYFETMPKKLSNTLFQLHKEFKQKYGCVCFYDEETKLFTVKVKKFWKMAKVKKVLEAFISSGDVRDLELSSRSRTVSVSDRH